MTPPYSPAVGLILVSVLREQDGNVLGLGRVEAGGYHGVPWELAAMANEYPVGSLVAFRGGQQPAKSPLYRLLSLKEGEVRALVAPGTQLEDV